MVTKYEFRLQEETDEKKEGLKPFRDAFSEKTLF